MNKAQDSGFTRFAGLAQKLFCAATVACLATGMFQGLGTEGGQNTAASAAATQYDARQTETQTRINAAKTRGENTARENPRPESQSRKPQDPLKKPLKKSVTPKPLKVTRAPHNERDATCAVSAARFHASAGSAKLARAAHGAELTACVKRKQGSTLPSLDLPS